MTTKALLITTAIFLLACHHTKPKYWTPENKAKAKKQEMELMIMVQKNDNAPKLTQRQMDKICDCIIAHYVRIYPDGGFHNEITDSNIDEICGR
jgi:hypothetical protein